MVSRKEAEEKILRLTTLAKGFSDEINRSPYGRDRRSDSKPVGERTLKIQMN